MWILGFNFSPFVLAFGKKVKFTPEQVRMTQRAHMGSTGNCIALSLSPALVGGGGGQCHAPTVLFPGKGTGAHFIGGWVDPKASFDRYGNIAPTGFPSPNRPARNKSLYRLCYRGPHCPSVPIRKGRAALERTWSCCKASSLLLPG